jgi:hypothetical protein
MDFYDLLQLSELRAIHSALQPTLDSVWRIRCRTYSERFHTPLHEVVRLDPEFVLQHLNESKYQPSEIEEEMEEILDVLMKIKDPTYSRMSATEVEDLVDAVMNKEIKRVGKKKQSKEVELPKPKIPKSGGMDFKALEESESAKEQGQSGFED